MWPAYSRALSQLPFNQACSGGEQQLFYQIINTKFLIPQLTFPPALISASGAWGDDSFPCEYLSVAPKETKGALQEFATKANEC